VSVKKEVLRQKKKKNDSRVTLFGLGKKKSKLIEGLWRQKGKTRPGRQVKGDFVPQGKGTVPHQGHLEESPVVGRWGKGGRTECLKGPIEVGILRSQEKEGFNTKTSRKKKKKKKEGISVLSGGGKV